MHRGLLASDVHRYSYLRPGGPCEGRRTEGGSGAEQHKSKGRHYWTSTPATISRSAPVPARLLSPCAALLLAAHPTQNGFAEHRSSQNARVVAFCAPAAPTATPAGAHCVFACTVYAALPVSWGT